MPRPVAVAVVRDVPPLVFVANDLEILHWVLALRWVAAVPGNRVPLPLRDRLRMALMEQRWADAVVAFMAHSGLTVDVYESHDLYEASDVAMGPEELQFRPLFRD